MGTRPTREVPRWRFCLKETSNLLQYALGRMYVKQAFDASTKAQVCKAMFFFIKKMYYFYKEKDVLVEHQCSGLMILRE